MTTRVADKLNLPHLPSQVHFKSRQTTSIKPKSIQATQANPLRGLLGFAPVSCVLFRGLLLCQLPPEPGMLLSLVANQVNPSTPIRREPSNAGSMPRNLTKVNPRQANPHVLNTILSNSTQVTPERLLYSTTNIKSLASQPI